jgi:hypothetical protein
MNSREEEKKSIERVERAFRARMNAFEKLNTQFYPKGNGIVNIDALDEFEATETEFKDADQEMTAIAEQIRNGTRK